MTKYPKIIHTSDWHLGKRLYNVSRLKEQGLYLEWLCSVIIEQSIDGLLISGDIFDTPNPPADALKLYFDFLEKITKKSSCKIYIISGNHDSGKFIEAPRSILGPNNIHVIGRLDKDPKNHTFKLYGQNSESFIEIFLLPYFRSYELYNLDSEKIKKENSRDEIATQLCDNLTSFVNNGISQNKSPKVLMAHHIFGNYEMSGSEHTLSLSGIENIPTDQICKNFNYVALGHIHKYQTLSKESPVIHYSGSPITFRFSESKNKKISIVSFEEDSYGKITVNNNLVDIPKFKNIVSIKCNEKGLANKVSSFVKETSDLNIGTLLEVQVNLSTPNTQITDTIREIIKDTDIELISVQTSFSQNNSNTEKEHQNTLIPSTSELFDQFYLKKFPDESIVPKDIKCDFLELLEECNNPLESEE